mmetsp:Transcript_18206/g.41138  ORF Transcript_18206/g.41138 Transcript_18206/m.41138 type:complete len:249 (+) Transcript_18206:455-1201(+)
MVGVVLVGLETADLHGLLEVLGYPGEVGNALVDGLDEVVVPGLQTSDRSRPVVLSLAAIDLCRLHLARGDVHDVAALGLVQKARDAEEKRLEAEGLYLQATLQWTLVADTHRWPHPLAALQEHHARRSQHSLQGGEGVAVEIEEPKFLLHLKVTPVIGLLCDLQLLSQPSPEVGKAAERLRGKAELCGGHVHGTEVHVTLGTPALGPPDADRVHAREVRVCVLAREVFRVAQHAGEVAGRARLVTVTA